MNKSELLDKKNIEDILALTPVQEGMLFHYLKDPGSTKHFEQLYLEISGSVDIQCFQRAWNRVIHTNEVLRTVFRWEKVKAPVQVVLKKHDVDLRFVDLAAQNRNRSETLKQVEEVKASDRNEAFELRDVPFRVTLCKIAEGKFGIIISNHHILYDGWSNGIILKEFFNAYNDLSRGKDPAQPTKSKFRDFIKWGRSQDKERQQTFWKEYFKGFENQSRSAARGNKEITAAGTHSIEFSAAQGDKIGDFCKAHKISLPSLFYSAWGRLVQEYNGCSDVLFDTTVSGRSAKIKGIEDMVGLFINTLPMRVKTVPGEKVMDLLHRVNHGLQQWEEFENTSLLTINETIDEFYNGSLFDSVVVIENYPLEVTSILEKSGFSVDSFSNTGMTHYDLTVLITVSGSGGIHADFIYNREVFNRETAAAVSSHFISFIDKMAADPWKPLAGIKISQRPALPVRDQEHWPPVVPYEAPADEVEQKLSTIWANVLKVDKGQIGRGADFFQFGGHSLKASLLAAAVHKEFNIKISLAQVFKHPTLGELSQYLKNSTGDKYSQYLPLETAEKKEYYALASVQERFYALQQLDPGSTAYNVTTALVVEGALDKKRLEETFKYLICRHESLRTSFRPIEGKPVQKIHRKENSKFQITNYKAPAGHPIKIPNSKSQITKMIQKFVCPFDLSQAPLLRVGLVPLEERTHLLMMDMHHIISDGFSMDKFIKEFTTLLTGKDRESTLPALTYRYKDFPGWQKARITSGKPAEQEEYWLKELSGELPVLNMLTDFPRASIQSFAGDRVRIRLDEPLTRRLRRLTAGSGTTLFMVLLTALNVLLYRYTGQEDIIIGTTVAGRDHIDLQDIVGLFIETLVLRNRPAGGKRFADFLREVKENTLQAFENGAYPFGELMKKVVKEADAVDISRNPLFNVMLIVQNIDMSPLETGGLKFIPVEFHKKVSKVDLTVEVFEMGDTIRLDLEYCTALFRRDTMERLAGHLQAVLEQVARQPGIPLHKVEILNNEERRQLLEDFKDSNWEYQSVRKEVHHLFEKRLEQGADTVALVYEEEQITYRELNRKADLLSNIIEEL
jgi:non-ribosomal peptide synthetase component F